LARCRTADTTSDTTTLARSPSATTAVGYHCRRLPAAKGRIAQHQSHRPVIDQRLEEVFTYARSGPVLKGVCRYERRLLPRLDEMLESSLDQRGQKPPIGQREIK